MIMKNCFLSFASILAAALLLLSCHKESLVDLSHRGGNWTVTECNEPGSDGAVPVPDEKGIFAVGDRIEYSAKSNGTDRLSLFRTVQVNGTSSLFQDDFKCTVSGDELTLQEEVYGGSVYGGSNALRFTYTIQKLSETEFVLKRTDLGKNEGIVSMRRL